MGPFNKKRSNDLALNALTPYVDYSQKICYGAF